MDLTGVVAWLYLRGDDEEEHGFDSGVPGPLLTVLLLLLLLLNKFSERLGLVKPSRVNWRSGRAGLFDGVLGTDRLRKNNNKREIFPGK